MGDIGLLKQGIPIGVAIFIRRISAAVVSVLALLVLMAAYGVRVDESYQALMIIAGLLSLMIVSGQPKDGHYSRRSWSAVIEVCGSWLLVIAILLTLGYATKTSSIFSRRLLFSWFVVTPPLIVAVHLAIDWIIARITLSAQNARRVVIAGANQLGQTLANKINSNPQFGMTLEGMFDDRSLERLGEHAEQPILGRLKDLPGYVKEHAIDLIYIVLPLRNIQRVTELIDSLRDTTASVYYVPDIFVFDLIQCRADDVDGVPVIALCESPYRGYFGVVKRASDIAISLSILLALSPLLVAIAVAIKLTSPGPVIFKQTRYGLDGRKILVYKFRSMTVVEDGPEVRQATRNDARITPFGAFLRRYSLDELPQFVNVLQGRMSVVGPRPHAVAHNEEYRGLIKGYMVRHKVNPGITGLAQIRGLRGETKTVEDMQRRVECDLEYMRNWSLGLDLKIIFRTARNILADKAAY